MECHGDRLPGLCKNTGVNDVERTMSANVRVVGLCRRLRHCAPLLRGQPTCGMPVECVALQETAGHTAPTRSGRSRRHRGACLGDGVRHGVPDDVIPRQAVESIALLFSLGQPEAGFLVKSMRSIPTNMVGQTCERVSDCCGSHMKRVVARRQDTVTFNEEQGAVLSGRKDTTSSRIRCQLW